MLTANGEWDDMVYCSIPIVIDTFYWMYGQSTDLTDTSITLINEIKVNIFNKGISNLFFSALFSFAHILLVSSRSVFLPALVRISTGLAAKNRVGITTLCRKFTPAFLADMGTRYIDICPLLSLHFQVTIITALTVAVDFVRIGCFK